MHKTSALNTNENKISHFSNEKESGASLASQSNLVPRVSYLPVQPVDEKSWEQGCSQSLVGPFCFVLCNDPTSNCQMKLAQISPRS